MCAFSFIVFTIIFSTNYIFQRNLYRPRIDFILITISFEIDKSGPKTSVIAWNDQKRTMKITFIRTFTNEPETIHENGQYERQPTDWAIANIYACMCECVCFSFDGSVFAAIQWICLLNVHIYMQIFSIIFLFHKFFVALFGIHWMAILSEVFWIHG